MRRTRAKRKLPACAIGLSMVAAAMIGMLVFSWRAWPDPIADFGRELYVPWQLAQGKVLYRDIAYFNGPLSPYFNSILVRIFGASLMTLAWMNILILAAVVLMLHRITTRISDQFTATVACLAFVILLAIGQPGPAANYNFITPYSHEMTHGFALALGAICCLSAYEKSRRMRWIAFAGLLLGLSFLTKPEIFLAAVGACTAGALFTACRFRVLAILLGTALVPVVVAIFIFGAAALGGWRWAFDPQLVNQPFYKFIRGTDDVGQSLALIGMIGAGYLIVLGISILVARFARVRGKNGVVAAGVAFVLVAMILGTAHAYVNWVEIARPLVVIAGATLVWVFVKDAKPQAAKENLRATRVAFASFAFVLLLKIPLHVLLYHYGFVLAAPALIVAIVAFVGWIPNWIDARGGCGQIARWGAMGALLVLCVVYLNLMSNNYTAKRVLVGAGSDAFYADARGMAVNEMIDILQRTPENSTLAAVPQGAMINFLARRANPTPYIVVIPPEIIMFSEDRIAASFAEHPPDLILKVQTDLREYGYHVFPDYAPKLAKLIDANYSPQVSRPTWMLLRKNP